MAADDRLVSRDSAVYKEFARLHQLAHETRPTGINRWSGNLYATNNSLWGGFDPQTGDLRLSEDLVLQHLTGRTSEVTPRAQAQALATVLHESTHTAMATDAPNEPNAIRSPHSQGAMEGVAELRATTDFEAFATVAGYPGLTLSKPQYPGVHAAMDSLVDQAAGPFVGRHSVIDRLTQGPGVMHFDQLAEAVIQNRLREVVPTSPEDRQAIRAALIQTMTHNHWPTLPDVTAETGRAVAEDIRRSLNSKVDEIRHHYQANPHQTFPADSPNQYAVRRAAAHQLSRNPNKLPTSASQPANQLPPQPSRLANQLPPQPGRLAKEAPIPADRILSWLRPCGFSVAKLPQLRRLARGHRSATAQEEQEHQSRRSGGLRRRRIVGGTEYAVRAVELVDNVRGVGGCPDIVTGSREASAEEG